MAINTDGPKKQGRFLKNSSKLLNHVQLVDFSFEEICTQPPVGFDNSSSTIIHSKFHDPKKLAHVIKSHATLDDPVFDPNQQALGIIFPADFTQDWHNERLQGKRRGMGFDEEDEIDFAAVARNRGLTGNAPQGAATAPPQAPELAPTPTKGTVIAAQPSSIASVGAPEMDGKVVPLSENIMGAAIAKEFITPELSARSVSAQAPLPAAALGGTEEEAAAHESQLSFTPLPTSSGAQPIAAEDLAIETWKLKQQTAKQNEEILDALRLEARAEGFQSGFREGEEKGHMNGQKNAAEVFKKVGELLHEFGTLKGHLLENAQKNFFDVSQAVAESLLGKEFSINPQAYATLIQRVIKDTTSPNEFKVRMHPDTWQKVHELSVPDLDSRLVKDPTIAVGEFRIESALTVVDVNAKKIVTQLLEAADINLFTDGSSTDKKVG